MTALRTAVCLAALVLVGGAAAAQPALVPLDDAGAGPVYRVTIDGMIDNALAQYVQRALDDAAAADAAAVVFRIDTFGGLLEAADQIRKAVLSSPVPTVAVVDRNAASAGAIIAYANDRIVFVPGASMGAATAVNGAGEYAPEKVQSYTRGMIRATAEATGRDPQIAEAMVDETIVVPGVVDDSTLLTLSADEAVLLGVADAELPSVDAAVEALGLADREQVTHGASTAERVLRFLGSPVLASILMMMMMGGLYFEIQTPGVGFAGAVAVVGAALFFAPHYLLGLVQAWEIALFVVGVGLLLVEVFVTPGFGVFGIAGIVAMLGALFIALIPNIGFAFPTDVEIARASTTLAAALVLVVLFAISLGRLLPKSERLNRLVLAPTLSSLEGYTSADTVAALVGQRGTALTGLRPSGTATVGGVRVDVVSEGTFVAPGAPVEVVSAAGSRVVVREVA
ncbi:NfeD family protein [Rubrivirga sp. S365]|uniref:NfeD family protein n=1 Tax=Rubrivirga litoralis TaxID=3075598 RepID=A0ABU3BS25_9BACT|nr:MULTISPECIES: NfeD family protein [unclassified Rubrivirga]MDT0632095.1 NfeD family protein [Rubrivirga sp. F394]MDT7856174.1 NfeD family protein [Rubrivirga sp. S365]